MSINLEKVDDKQLSSKYEKLYFTPLELEREFGFSRSWQSKARMRTSPIQLPFVKIGGKFILYNRDRIYEWLEDHEVQGSSYKKDNL